MVALYCEGMAMKQIAARFSTNDRCVQHAVQFLMRKHDLKTHGQLGVWFERRCKAVA